MKISQWNVLELEFKSEVFYGRSCCMEPGKDQHGLF
jgi:hypothetical protein